MTLSSLIAYIREVLRTPTYHDNLEAYITAGNPQNACDIDRLEREYHAKRKQQLNVFDRYY